MSITIMSSVFKCNMPELKTNKGVTVSDSAAKFVLLALADHCNDDGQGAYPGIKAICRKTNLSTGTVVHALNALRLNGFTELEGRSRRNTFNYSVLVDTIARFQWLESPDSTGKNRAILVARVNPSLNHPSQTSKKEAPTARAVTPVEVQVFRSVTGKFPNRVNFPEVVKAVGLVSERLRVVVSAQDLLPFYRAWCARGLNPVGIGWLDWAVSGQSPTKPQQGKGSARVQARADETQEQREARVNGAIERLYKAA